MEIESQHNDRSARNERNESLLVQQYSVCRMIKYYPQLVVISIAVIVFIIWFLWMQINHLTITGPVRYRWDVQPSHSMFRPEVWPIVYEGMSCPEENSLWSNCSFSGRTCKYGRRQTLPEVFTLEEAEHLAQEYADTKTNTKETGTCAKDSRIIWVITLILLLTVMTGLMCGGCLITVFEWDLGPLNI